MGIGLDEAKEAVIEVARRAFDVGLQRYSGGNLSAITDDRLVVIKPSGVGYHECARDNLMVVDLDGNIVEGSGKPSKDMGFHLAIYKVRDDVGGIQHTHSPWATSFAVAERQIPLHTLHAKAKLGCLPLIPLAPDGGTQGSAQVGPVFEDKVVMAALMARHGPISVGGTLLQAQYLAELIEETAHIACMELVLSG